MLLRGGQTTSVSLVDGTVRRAAGPWTPAVHPGLTRTAATDGMTAAAAQRVSSEAPAITCRGEAINTDGETAAT